MNGNEGRIVSLRYCFEKYHIMPSSITSSFFIFFVGASLFGIESTNAIGSSSSISSSRSSSSSRNNSRSNGDGTNGMPNLPFGDINVVVLTDLHSWVRYTVFRSYRCESIATDLTPISKMFAFFLPLFRILKNYNKK